MKPDMVIAIPTFNEAGNIERLVSHFLSDCRDAQILIVDGGSTDGTVEISRSLDRRYRRVTLLHNQRKLQAAGINLAAHWAAQNGVRFLIRADAHAHYPKGFANGVLDRLKRLPTDSVVVPLIAQPTMGWAAANALLQQSWLGNGGAAHRGTACSGYVDHGHHAGFRVSAFLALGGYDEALPAAEDVDFDHRLRSNGGAIYLSADKPVGYLPRNTPSAVFKQFFRNGYWRAHVWKKHGTVPSTRQILPCIAVLMVMAFAIIGLFIKLFFIIPAAYLSAVLILSMHAGRTNPIRVPQIGILALLTHFGYALGVTRQLLFRARRWPLGTEVLFP